MGRRKHSKKADEKEKEIRKEQGDKEGGKENKSKGKRRKRIDTGGAYNGSCLYVSLLGRGSDSPADLHLTFKALLEWRFVWGKVFLSFSFFFSLA